MIYNTTGELEEYQLSTIGGGHDKVLIAPPRIMKLPTLGLVFGYCLPKKKSLREGFKKKKINYGKFHIGS